MMIFSIINNKQVLPNHERGTRRPPPVKGPRTTKQKHTQRVNDRTTRLTPFAPNTKHTMKHTQPQHFSSALQKAKILGLSPPASPLPDERVAHLRIRQHACDQHGDGEDGPGQKQRQRQSVAGGPIENGVQTAATAARRGHWYTARQVPPQESHTGVRGNEAADKLANMKADIEEGHRLVERGSAEPAREEHKDNG